MKTIINLLCIAACAISLSACDKDARSYDKSRKKEQKAIDKLIDEQNFEILSTYPSNGVFKENQFVYIDGVYLNVIDSGNGNRAIEGKTRVLMRCVVKDIQSTDTSFANTFADDYLPIEFIHGNALASSSKYLGVGVQSALKHVGENGVVRMIVPFNVGSKSYQQEYYHALFYDKIKFTFSIYN